MSKTPNAWLTHCRELAAWAWERLAIKRDRHGMYSVDGSAAWSFSEVTVGDLAAHFAGKITLGLGATSLDDQCLWVAWDMDNHVSDIATNQNLDYGIVLRDRLRALGFNAVLIEDSDGKGGIHGLCLFQQSWLTPSRNGLLVTTRSTGLRKSNAFRRTQQFNTRTQNVERISALRPNITSEITGRDSMVLTTG